MSNKTCTKESDRVFIGAHIPAALKEKLDAHAMQADESFSSAVRRALRIGVAHFEELSGGVKASIHCAKPTKRSARVARNPLKQ